jgi:hypothetical protein
MEMSGGVPVPGVIAAADMATGAAQSQMHPRVSELEAFFTAVGVALIRLHEVQVMALV